MFIRYGAMKRLRFSRYAKTRLKLAGALVGAGLMLHSCGEAEAEPKADPREVQLFLSQMENGERASVAEEEAQDGDGKRLRNIVQDAATRAPSDAMVNRIETVVAGRLG